MNKTLQLLDIHGIHLCVAEAGSGFPLVFLHGLGWDHQLWNEAFSRYANHYHVIAGDTRGHGQSDKPDAPVSIEQFAQDWLSVLDMLKIDQATLIGFSQGGMVAMMMAIAQPQRFKSLVLACTTCCNPPAVDANMQERLQLLDRMGAVAAATLASESIFSAAFIKAHPEYIAAFIQQRAAADQNALKRSMLAAKGFNVCTQLQMLQQPCLVIAGEQDQLTPPIVARQVHEQLPHSSFVTLAETGHMIPVEQPQRFYQVLDRFLEVEQS